MDDAPSFISCVLLLQTNNNDKDNNKEQHYSLNLDVEWVWEKIIAVSKAKQT